MVTEDPQARFNDIEKELKTVFYDSFQQLVNAEMEKILAVSENIRKILENYSKKLSGEEKISSRSHFLFETINAISGLKSQVENTVNEDARNEFLEGIQAIHIQLMAFFKLDENQQEQKEKQPETDDKKSTGFPKKYQNRVSGLFSRLFRRQKMMEDPVGNYILDAMIVPTLEAVSENIGDLDKSITDLLQAHWLASEFIVEKGNKIIESDFQFPEEENFFSFIIDSTDIEDKEKELKEAAGNLHQSFEEAYLEAKETLHKNNFKPPIPESGKEKPPSTNLTIRRVNNAFKKSTGNHEGWQNTKIVLADDWLLEMEISILKYNILKQSFDFSAYVRSRFRDPIENKLTELETTVKELITLFDKENGQKQKDLIGEIQKVRKDIKRKMVLHIVPEMQKTILESNIPARIDEFEKATAQEFKQLSVSRRIIVKPEYSRPINTNEIEKISPVDLVSFQMMPDFMKQFPSLKQAFTRHLQEVQTRMEEIPEILDFSLMTALNFVEEKKETGEAIKIGSEGIQRAENKIHDIQELIDVFFKKEVGIIRSGIETLVEQLSEITDNENALQIKFRIAKSKAIEKSKELRNRIKDYVLNILPAVRKLFDRFVTFLRESTIQIRKQFIIEDQKHFVSTDVSDYLAETEQAINRLPFIYQRLFKTEPLHSFELYTERPDSLETIKTAYTRWKDGKFAPTVLIAERGWGKTTLINRFLKLKITSEKVLEFKPKLTENIEDFYNSILEKTENLQEENSEDRMPEDRKIVVLDGLERLFETRINGFSILQKFLQHISNSNEAVFWLITCQKQAWDYLDKILSISDYFGYHIRISEFSKEMLVQIIERRHNISGYRLMFLPEAQKKTLISFKKQTDFGDQEELKEQYFTRMHKIVSGNLSQAFLFWMRSTAHVTEDSVFIEYLKSDYFNFLGSMSDTKLRMLKFIVLHNGITPEKLAELLRLSPEKSLLYLTQLHDDGIIIKKETVYDVNPIIYRQVIDQLYLMNILH